MIKNKKTTKPKTQKRRGTFFMVESDVTFMSYLKVGLVLGIICAISYYVLKEYYGVAIHFTQEELTYKNSFLAQYNFINIFSISITVVLVVGYKFFTFSDIHQNKWYSFVQFGFNPIKIFFQRLGYKVAGMIALYLCSYVFNIVFCLIMGFPLHVGQCFSFFFLGLLNMLVIFLGILTVSLITRSTIIARSIVPFVLIFIVICLYLCGYFTMVSSNSIIENVGHIFTYKFSAYTIFVTLWLSVMLVACIFLSRRLLIYNTSSVTDYSKYHDIDIMLYSSEHDAQIAFEHDSAYYKENNVDNIPEENKGEGLEPNDVVSPLIGIGQSQLKNIINSDDELSVQDEEDAIWKAEK